MNSMIEMLFFKNTFKILHVLKTDTERDDIDICVIKGTFLSSRLICTLNYSTFMEISSYSYNLTHPTKIKLNS